ncbi:GPI ethanolamine phosphate transferase 1 isoform X2 [Drosophila innubila]|uniref:GPI ethanolamine phosphate transferase 1 isoform X2 n=1 Tax=Drosophila innubila TaxID=198719 RepID=UPI00148E7129|nr:GPI ethanolamine phosphate transferase 1 isoform X2 [Drosophila innubila]
MWTLGQVFALQFLLMCSVYVIYFQSNVVTHLEPQPTLMKHAPADRLVIFITDGLSAKSFFEDRCINVQELSKIFMHQGQVGIIRTLGSTNCRSAQVALFSGFYESPFSAFDYWSSKAVTCDTLFNRSSLSYAWGSAKFLKHLAVVNKISVPYDVMSIASKDSYKLDEWTFDDIDRFLDSESKQLQNIRGLVIVVHLVGLLFANGMDMYRKNINYTQRGIWKTYNRFEQTFSDQRTSYLLISDHGMTSMGLFGGKTKEEIETPFFLWGAGVSNTKSSPGRTFVANKEMKRLPLSIMEQIQLTPLMSTLVGLPPPVNNRGQMPSGVLNASDRYESHAVFTNALQLVDLAKHRLQHHERGLLASCMPSHWMNLQQLDKFVYSGNLLWHQRRFLTLNEYSSNMMPVLMQCIEYYESYYRRGLLVAITFGFLGWQHHLRCQLASPLQASNTRSPQLLLARMLVHVTILLMIIFLLLQRVPWVISGFLLLPGFIWRLALNAHERSEKLSSCVPLLVSLCCLTGFIDRRLMGLCYLVFAFYQNREVIMQRSLESYIWMIVVCALASLSCLPPTLGFHHRGSFIVSIILTFLQPIAFLGPSLSRSHRRNLICNGLVMLLACIHVWFSARPRLLHLMARAYLCYVFYPRFRQQGIELTIYNLSTLYTLLCTSYEAVVIQVLTLELQLALRLKNNKQTGNQTLAIY